MNKDIHFYATYSAARLAGMPTQDALKLAYFCQSCDEYSDNSAYQQVWLLGGQQIQAPKQLTHALAAERYPFTGIASNYWDLTHGYSSLFKEEAQPTNTRSTQQKHHIHNTHRYFGAGATFTASSHQQKPNEATAKTQETHQQRAVKNLIRKANPLTSYFWAGQFDRKHSLRGFFGINEQPAAPIEPSVPSDFIEIDDEGNAIYVSGQEHTQQSSPSRQRDARFTPSETTHPAANQEPPFSSGDTPSNIDPTPTNKPIIGAVNKADSRAHRDLLQHSIYTLGHGCSLAHLGVGLFCYQKSWLHDETGQVIAPQHRQSLDLFALFHGTKRVIEKYLAHQAIPLEGSFNHYFESLNQVAECLFYSGNEEQRSGHWKHFIGHNIDKESANPWQELALQYNPYWLLHRVQQTHAVDQYQIIDETAFWQSDYGQHLHALQEVAQWHEQLIANSSRYIA